MNQSADPKRSRLEALKKLHLMDTAPEERFDRICRIASQLLQTPIAYVSLLDDERQFFKSAVGLGEIRETPREGSFCTHTIEAEQSLYVPDACTDERFKNSPYVQGPPGVRCYLGEPLFSSDGYAVGTFCILDLEPRELDPQLRATFRDLADLAERELQLLAQLHQQRKLTELTSHLASSLEQREIGEVLLQTLTETVHFDRAAVAVREGPHLKIIAVIGDRSRSDRLTDHDGPPSCFAEPAVESVRVPILHQGRELGVLWVERMEELSFSRIELEQISSFVVQAGLILENRSILANLFEQSRLTSLGSLASGVAHEINSPLGAARLGVESALRILDPGQQKLAKKLYRVNDSLTRASNIIKSVLQYAGEGPAIGSVSDLDAIVGQALALIQHDLRSAKVSVELNLKAKSRVGFPQNELLTLVHNLLQNAFWAVLQPGATARTIRLFSCREQDRTLLRVLDSGPGVRDSIRGRIFDPFFTTKEPGEGVGLGLSVSRRLAEQAGGRLEFHPSEGGTEFRLTLPTSTC